jgi:heterodisulfide reductase subunit A2
MDKQEEPRVGVYICHCGGNISDVVDVQKVCEHAQALGGVAVARTHMFMCSDPGQQLIQEDIKREGLNRVVVASCSPRLHEQTFRRAVQRGGLNPYLYEHANIREQVSWVTHNDPAAATHKAAGLVGAAVAKAKELEPLDSLRVNAWKRAIVLGGGVSGLKCALDLAAYGIPVTLVEKSPFLGGRMAQLDRLYPTGEEALSVLQPLLEKVTTTPEIDILTYANVVEISGYVGNFTLQVQQLPRGVKDGFDKLSVATAACPVEVPTEQDFGLTMRKAIYKTHPASQPSTPAIDWDVCDRCSRCVGVAGGEIDLNQEPKTVEVKAGIVVVATGFDPYVPGLAEYGYGEFPEVITLPQAIRLIADQRKIGADLNWKGRMVRSVAFIHCVGSRQIEGIHQPKEGEKLHEYCSRVCCTTTLAAANDIREYFPETQVFDFHRDIRTYGQGHEEYYENASRKGVVFFRFAPEEQPVVERANGESKLPLVVRVKDLLTWGEEVEVPVDLVVLGVGMVPRDVNDIVSLFKLPVGTDEFLLEVHPKLRPVESAVNGVLLAGTAQGPKDITESTVAASAAAARAASLLSRGYVELDPFVAEIDSSLCDGCGKCIESCGYPGTITLHPKLQAQTTEGKVAEVNTALCKGCGACVAACPQRAIQVKGWTLGQFDAMVDAICENDLVTEGAR